MTDLMVVYGSETRLLAPLYDRPNTFFIKIYNQSRPAEKGNVAAVQSVSECVQQIAMARSTKEINRIIFIGAAFKTQRSLMISMKPEETKRILSTNIENYVEYTSAVLPEMLKVRSGVFIYLSSFRSTVTGKGAALYSASKAFGEVYFSCLGKENGKAGVRSSSIRMGYFDGRMTEALSDAQVKGINKHAGLSRLGSADELCNCINFVISNPYTNGGVIDLAGGINHEF